MGIRVHRVLLTAFLGLSVFLFWAFLFRSALSYQEQFQMFLCSFDYFKEAVSLPGGLARYVGEFFVQFFYMPMLGALVMSLLSMAVQVLSFCVARSIRKDIGMLGYLLSFIPSLLLWLYMGDENVLFSFGVASLFLLLTSLFYGHISNPSTRILSAPAMALSCYWLFGTVVYAFVVFAILFEISRNNGIKQIITTGVVSCLSVVAAIILSSHVVNYPMDSLLSDIVYYRIPMSTPLMQYAIMVLLAVVPFVCSIRLSDGSVAVRRGGIVASAMVLVYLFVMVVGVRVFYDAKKYELIEYDFLVRTNNWKAIIDKSRSKQPDAPLSVCATNLALGMTGQLCDRAFNFFQNGTEGLLPHFRRDPNSLLTTAEAYFLLGMTNTAERFYFEAMEGIPNYAKSCRCLKRIAEANLLNGNYIVADKFLCLLENTLFYKKWATQTRALMNSEAAVDKHIFYGKLRNNRLTNDFLFSEEEKDKILGQIFIKNPDNQLALQYLLLYPLLQRDVNTFMQYLSVVQRKRQYNPILCQQAVVFAYSQINQPIPPNLVLPAIVEDFKRFASIVSTEGKNSDRLLNYSNTLWYYLLVGSSN